MLINTKISNQIIDNELFIKREDAIHPIISGNKYRKLKYNLSEAKNKGFTTLLTFGGAHSNHIAALAACGKEFDFKTIGIIRGEELVNKVDVNPTLSYAKTQGMLLEFITRTAYRKKDDFSFISELKTLFGDFYLIPEGGTNELAVKGCEEILNEEDSMFDFICCSVGTGGTISGLINSSKSHQKILGFPALKGGFLQNDIRKFARQDNWELIEDYHFGGYAKINAELVTFLNDFKAQYNVLLDPIYTGKMMYGIYKLRERDYFPKGSKILAIHTGGLQGIKGMNMRLKQKGLPQIHE